MSIENMLINLWTSNNSFVIHILNSFRLLLNVMFINSSAKSSWSKTVLRQSQQCEWNGPYSTKKCAIQPFVGVAKILHYLSSIDSYGLDRHSSHSSLPHPLLILYTLLAYAFISTPLTSHNIQAFKVKPVIARAICQLLWICAIASQKFSICSESLVNGMNPRTKYIGTKRVPRIREPYKPVHK
jgi:hypothetical protein